MIEGYVDYKRREYCKDIKCPIQLKLEFQKEGSKEYEEVRSRTNIFPYLAYPNGEIMRLVAIFKGMKKKTLEENLMKLKK